MANVCLFLSASLLLPTVHEVHALVSDKSPGLRDPTHTHASNKSRAAPSPGDDRVYPFVVDDAVVTGVASAADQAAFDADLPPPGAHAYALPQRSLLHGKRNPWTYSKCDRCMIVSCKNGNCSGHCKKNKKLYFCRSRRVREFPLPCVQLQPEELSTLPVDSLGDYDSAIVTAPAPYIGCAEIAGKSTTGCPERHTRASLPGGAHAVVLESKCMAERYLPHCPGQTPLYPFGICECRILITRPQFRIERGPCNFAQLSRGTPTIAPPGNAAADEVAVHSDGDVTRTGFIDYVEDGEEPDVMHTRVVRVGGGDITVKLEVFHVRTAYANPEYGLEEEEDFAEEYAEVYGEEPDVDAGGWWW